MYTKEDILLAKKECANFIHNKCLIHPEENICRIEAQTPCKYFERVIIPIGLTLTKRRP